ncbi:hypothetical protein [Paenibacillus alvei]|nr:hypothetical protein [Paenibacillus alvei]SYX87673.1 conserved protein of unknown function [Paenibacillus alvei]
MNKLTDDVRDGIKEAFDNLVGLDIDEQYKLFLSEQAGWEEVERLTKENKYLAAYKKSFGSNLQAAMKETKKLKLHLQDAINTLKWYAADESWHTEVDEAFPAMYDCGSIAKKAIQRIQEG